MAIITSDRIDTRPTNRDCISYIYGYYENDNPAIPTEIYYRWCKPETTPEGMHRRENFTVRRREYFDGPAIKKGTAWYPERYLPDPEDPEWSWKEGLEMEMPAMSVYQLNECKVFWDPYKHRRNKGEQPYYRWYGHANAVNDKLPPNPMVHVQRPTMHGEKFSRRWYPSSGFDTRGPKDQVMYHPKYKGPKVSDLMNNPNWRSIAKEDIFQPPEGEEWIEKFSEKRTPRKSEKKAKIANRQIDADPFDTKQMRPYREEAQYSNTNEEYSPENRARWGKLKTKPQLENIEGQQGYMSKEEVAGEPTTSGTANPKFKIPKLSERREITTDKLNNLSANISPPAKERKRETSSSIQPHKNKKGRQHGHISGIRKSGGGRRK